MVVIFFALPAETLMRQNSSIIITTADPDRSYVSTTIDGQKTIKIRKDLSTLVLNRTMVQVLKLILIPIPSKNPSKHMFTNAIISTIINLHLVCTFYFPVLHRIASCQFSLIENFSALKFYSTWHY